MSTLEELYDGAFQTVLGEIDDIDPGGVDRLVLCSGKVYYELLEARRAANAENVVILRIEQLYPYPREDLARAIASYKRLRRVVWCQEEPMNQGAWFQTQHKMRQAIAAHEAFPNLEICRQGLFRGDRGRLHADA